MRMRVREVCPLYYTYHVDAILGNAGLTLGDRFIMFLRQALFVATEVREARRHVSEQTSTVVSGKPGAYGVRRMANIGDCVASSTCTIALAVLIS